MSQQDLARLQQQRQLLAQQQQQQQQELAQLGQQQAQLQLQQQQQDQAQLLLALQLSAQEEEARALEEDSQFDDAVRQSLQDLDFPRPSWLRGDGIHVALVGQSGVGKSTLLNWLRCVPDSDRDAARTGALETTMEPRSFRLPEDPWGEVLLWDLPGAGTRRHPEASYIQDVGLRHFHVIVIVSEGRLKEVDHWLYVAARGWRLPVLLVRTYADRDFHSDRFLRGVGPQDTLQQLQAEVNHQLEVEEDDFFVASNQAERCPAVVEAQMQRLIYRLWEVVESIRFSFGEVDF